MASVPVLSLLLVLLVPVHANAQQNQSNVIHLGSSLSPNANRTCWVSPSGLFAFGFYPQNDGFAIGIWLLNQTEKTVIWTANRDNPPVSSNATLELTIDGELLLRTEQGIELSISDVDDAASSAAMLDSGNFVLYGNDSNVIWDSFDFPTDTILGGQNLSGGHNLVSSVSISDHSSGRYSLNMELDGNLVAYPVNSSDDASAYWSSDTSKSGYVAHLVLTRLGVLLVRASGLEVSILANSSYPDKNGTTIYHATLDADGIFRLYLHQIKSGNSSSMLMEWSALSNQCEVKGFCGLNSYCSGKGSKADCNCYPGFDFINTSNKFLGCHQNFNEDDCGRSEDPEMLYNVASLENVWWTNDPYSVKLIEKKACGKSCLEDCNCGAVLYRDAYCSKYKLPHRYGRIRNATKPSIAFFKVYHPCQVHEVVQVHEVLIESKKSLILILSIILGSVLCLCLVLATSSMLVYRHKFDRYRKLTENVNLGLAEEFTLRRSIEVNVSTADEIILSNWVYDCFAAGELDKLVKDENVDFRTLERMVKVGLWCVQEDPTLRHSMKNVVLMLEGTINVPIPPSPVLSIVVSLTCAL
ncbi:hypothetical protein CMV_025114 [Castanea mollissima]|uniref:Bulb-type lectin domain-containing protein n=1 Tax=Castanea mollissima TaxID=60419 RepID=A0A8J4QDR5_9ROSI|nr:hypothetical protein CMV_025114 [Castanea mollissima]